MAKKSSKKETKPVLKQWWFWGIIVAVCIIIVLILIIVANQNSNDEKKDSKEITYTTAHQDTAIAGLRLALAYSATSETGKFYRSSCETIKEAVKNYDSSATWFSNSFCTSDTTAYGKNAETDADETFWLSDGNYVAKIVYIENGLKSYIKDYSFYESSEIDDFYKIRLVSD